MSKQENIIRDLENDYQLDLDVNFDTEILCDGDTCRSSECACWDTFRWAVEQQLIAQEKEADVWESQMQEMRSLYIGEVSAGVHMPSYKNPASENFRGED